MTISLPQTIRSRVSLLIAGAFLVAGGSLCVVLSRLATYRDTRATASLVPAISQDVLLASVLVQRGLAGDLDAAAGLDQRAGQIQVALETLRSADTASIAQRAPEDFAQLEVRITAYLESCRKTLGLDASRDTAFQELGSAIEREVTDLVFLERGYADLGEDYEYHLEELEDTRAQLATLWREAVRMQVLPQGDERDQVGFFLALTDEKLTNLFVALRDGSDELELDPTEEGPVLTALEELVDRHQGASASLAVMLEKGTQLAASLDKLNADLDPLLQAQGRLEEACTDVIVAGLESLRLVTLVGFGAVLGLICFLARFLSKGVLARIQSLREVVHGIAAGEGDLTQRIPDRGVDEFDQLARWFNVFLGDMEKIVAHIRGVGEELLAANDELASEGRSVEVASQDQAQGVEQASVGVHEMRNATEKASSLISSVREAATTAEKHVMGIRQSAARMQETIQSIDSTSEGVSKAMKGVEDVAFQTRLLALNATVEAARAGDAGRGFGVVAEEVRSLAVRSAETATSIMEALELSRGHTESGLHEVDALVGALGSIDQAARETTRVAAEIDSACGGQLELATGATESIQGVGSLSKSNVERAARLAQFCQQTKGLSEQLADLVGRFQVGTAA